MQTISPPVAWPQLLDIATTILPCVAAWAAGRQSWRDPMGQIGLAWGTAFLCSLVQLLGKLTGQPSLIRVGLLVAGIALPLLLIPPLLALVGARAARWSALLQGLTLAAALTTLATVGPGRQYALLYSTPMHFGLLLLSLGVLIAQAGLASDPQSDAAAPGWLWIGVGHLVYFATYVVGRPLIEVLVSSGWSAAVDAHMGTMLVYSGTMAAIGWGIWLGHVPRPVRVRATVLPASR